MHTNCFTIIKRLILTFLLGLIAMQSVPEQVYAKENSNFNGTISIETEPHHVLNTGFDYSVPIFISFYNKNQKAVAIPSDAEMRVFIYKNNELIDTQDIPISPSGSDTLGTVYIDISPSQYTHGDKLDYHLIVSAGISQNNTQHITFDIYSKEMYEHISLTPGDAVHLNIATENAEVSKVYGKAFSEEGNELDLPSGLKLQYYLNEKEGSYYQAENTFMGTFTRSSFKGLIGEHSVYSALINTNIPFEPVNSTIIITSEIHVQEIKFDSKELFIDHNQTEMLFYTLSPANATNIANIRFESDNPEVASISENGVITTAESGTAKITVTVDDVSNSINVTVAPQVKSVEMATSNIYLTSGGTYQMTYQTMPEFAMITDLIWSTDDFFVADVDDTGLITANKPGMTTLHLLVNNEFEAKATIIVLDELKQILLDSNSVYLSVGQNEQIQFTTLPAEAKGKIKMEWSSSNSDVASVTSAGVVVAKAPGKATIKIKHNDCEAELEVFVDKNSLPISLKTTEISLDPGQNMHLKDMISYPEVHEVEWTISNGDIAFINDGSVVCTGSGATNLFAKYDGDTKIIQINCKQTSEEPEVNEKEEPEVPDLSKLIIKEKHIKIYEDTNKVYLELDLEAIFGKKEEPESDLESTDQELEVTEDNETEDNETEDIPTVKYSTIEIQKVSKLQSYKATTLTLQPELLSALNKDGGTISARLNHLTFYVNETKGLDTSKEIILNESTLLSNTADMHEQKEFFFEGVRLTPISVIFEATATNIGDVNNIIYNFTDEDKTMINSNDIVIVLLDKETNEILDFVETKGNPNTIYFKIPNDSRFIVMNAFYPQAPVQKDNSAKIIALSYLGGTALAVAALTLTTFIRKKLKKKTKNTK